jgi:GH24 family phage-related lysozyme (muramidase)
MYRDTVGKVTVGVGLMLPDAAAATKLPFLYDGRAATPVEITADFSRVAAMVEGNAAEFYRARDSPKLAQTTIDAKLRKVLLGFEDKLRAAIGGYDGLPVPVKLALLDMAYNLGPAGVLAGYPRLIAAVEQGRWTQAAAECLRQGPGAVRNAWTKQQFLAAVLGSIRAEAEDWLARARKGLKKLRK